MSRHRFEIDTADSDLAAPLAVFHYPANVTDWLRGAAELRSYHITTLRRDSSAENGWRLVETIDGEEWMYAVEQREADDV